MSMDVTSSQAWSVAATGSSASSRGSSGMIATAAKTLGMSVDDVTSALAQGSSLADLASAHGVSKDDLVQSLVAAAPSRLASSGDATEIVTRMVDRPGGPHGHGHGHGGQSTDATSATSSASALVSALGTTQQDTLDSLASLLGTDSTSLVGQLQSGTSLSDLLKDKGVTYSQLAGAVQDGLILDTTA